MFPPYNFDDIWEILVWILVLIPPIISLIYSFAFIKANIEPIYKNLDNSTISDVNIVKVVIRIMAIKIWTNNNEIKHLNQDLNKKDVELWDREIIAKGDNTIRTLIIINLNEYVNIRLKNPIDIIVFKTPSKEKISIEELNKRIELIFKTKVEKSILQLNIDSPKERNEEDNNDVKLIINSQKWKEKFIKKVQKRSLNKNWDGFSKLEII